LDFPQRDRKAAIGPMTAQFSHQLDKLSLSEFDLKKMKLAAGVNRFFRS
jgi:hypothetical protein